MNYSRIIKEIKSTLSIENFDELHDICHHYDVWKNTRDIIRTEKIRNIDEFSLNIAAWLHDFETYYDKPDRHFKTIELLTKHTVSKGKIKKIIDIIEHHSFSKQQNSIEAQILFDADKIEHISIPRWEYTLQAIKDGTMHRERLEYYVNLQNKLLTMVKDRLYFNYSKMQYLQKYVEFINYAKSIEIWDENGINLSNFLKSHEQ